MRVEPAAQVIASNRAAHRRALRLAVAEILVGALVLSWCVTQGGHDESSLGELFFFWGTLAGVFGLLIPGSLLLFVRHPVRWILQPVTALLVLFVVGALLLGQVHR